MTTHFQIVDWLVVGVYIIAMVLIAVYAFRNNHGASARNYFLAGQSMPWWAVGCSLFSSNIGACGFCLTFFKKVLTRFFCQGTSDRPFRKRAPPIPLHCSDAPPKSTAPFPRVPPTACPSAGGSGAQSSFCFCSGTNLPPVSAPLRRSPS